MSSSEKQLILDPIFNLIGEKICKYCEKTIKKDRKNKVFCCSSCKFKHWKFKQLPK